MGEREGQGHGRSRREERIMEALVGGGGGCGPWEKERVRNHGKRRRERTGTMGRWYRSV